ncbi:MAG: zinc-dependent alcohol dehydrogenase family protein [Rhodopirellula sp.]|nr:zinc-dependent alcohol dehydrogenase family protein [Rhodopirellula sp.]
MKAMILRRTISLSDCDEPLECIDLPVPEPQDGEVLLRVSVCGVCHTELDEIEGRTPPPSYPVIPGHEVIARVERLGRGVTRLKAGQRVGVGWIHSSSGDEFENLSPDFRATGRDVNGGYAEFMTVPENYAYPIPEVYSDAEAAPLLCAGAVGYRALKLTKLRDGQRLGLTGFGGSAHIVLQLARHRFPNSPVFVFARDQAAREFAKQLGAEWAGDTTDRPPEPLDAIIDTTPAWKPIVEALACLAPNGRLVVNAIRKENQDIQELTRLSYHEHLWMEREIKTVANVTQFDIREFLPLAAEIPIRPEVEIYPLHAANQALVDLKRKPVRGTKVLVVNEESADC